MTDGAIDSKERNLVITEIRKAPPTFWENVRRDTKALSALCLAGGVFSLGVGILGPAFVVAGSDLTSHAAIAGALQSTPFAALCASAIIVGVIVALVVSLSYRSLPSQTARRQATGGAILAIQGAAIGGFLWYFVQGNMPAFARTFLNFPQVTAWSGAFLNGMKWTIFLALAATASGIVLGLIVSVLLISENRLIRAPARVYVNVVRGTPILVQLSLVYFGLALGLNLNTSPQIALIATLALNNGAYVAEIFRAGTQSIEIGQLNAARGLGMTYTQSLRHVIFPQAVRRVVPPLMNDFITIIKESSLLIFLGATLSSQDMYSVASQGYAQYFNSTFFIAAALGYLVITLPLIGLVNQVERRIRSGLVNVGG